MDIRRNAARLTLIYTATLSRFGSGPCILRPTAMHADAIAPGTRSCHTRTHFFLVWEKGGFVRTLRTPLGYVPVIYRSMIFLLNLGAVVQFLLMTPHWVHAASPDSKLSCARISADLDQCCCWMGRQLGHDLQRRKKWARHLHIGKATGQRVTMRGVPIPQVKHHRHLGLVMNNKLSWTEHIKDVHGPVVKLFAPLLIRRGTCEMFDAVLVLIFVCCPSLSTFPVPVLSLSLTNFVSIVTLSPLYHVWWAMERKLY